MLEAFHKPEKDRKIKQDVKSISAGVHIEKGGRGVEIFNHKPTKDLSYSEDFCTVSDLKQVRTYKGTFENTATWQTPMIGKHVLSNNNFVADGK